MDVTAGAEETVRTGSSVGVGSDVGSVTVTVFPGIVRVTLSVIVAWIVIVSSGSSDVVVGELDTTAGREGSSEVCAVTAGVVSGIDVVGSDGDCPPTIVVVENGTESPEEM